MKTVAGRWMIYYFIEIKYMQCYRAVLPAGLKRISHNIFNMIE